MPRSPTRRPFLSESGPTVPTFVGPSSSVATNIKISAMSTDPVGPELPPYVIPITPITTSATQQQHHPAPQGYLIDFSKTPLSSFYTGRYAAVIDNLFTPAECAEMLALAQSQGRNWEEAQLNIGGMRQVLDTRVRNSSRILVDSREGAERIYKRVWPWVAGELGFLGRGEEFKWKHIMNPIKNPAKAKEMEGEKWEMTRVNERLRFLKYEPGQYFVPHTDGIFSTHMLPPPFPSLPEERSFITIQIYLSSSPDLVGGATSFYSAMSNGSEGEPVVEVSAVPGRVLVFQHRGLVHAGDPVIMGEKFTVRTDIMFKRVVEKEGKGEGEGSRE